MQESQESMESHVSLHTFVLIDSMALDYMDKEKQVSQEKLKNKTDKSLSPGSNKKSFADVVRESPQGVVTGDARGKVETGATIYKVESPDSSLDTEVIPTLSLATEENLRFSLRNVQSKMGNIKEKAVAAAKKRDIEDGVHIPDPDFVNIDVTRELEKFRNHNSNDEKVEIVENERGVGTMVLVNANGEPTPLDLNWSEENNFEDEEFTVVKSRKKNK
ncbi:hypothetical protein D1007_05657 [Hordeum vulgare]|nr:hypothetical protein D1007_05657 [Hordeum vulgare]